MQDQEILASIVVPAHNEEEAIGSVLDEVIATMTPLGIAYEIIVVDDGSTDGTRAVCEHRQGVKVISHAYNRGAGAARSTGVRVAKGRHIIMIDADGSYPTSVIPSMLDDLAEYDMVIGARDRETGTLRWLRSAAKNFIRALASYLTQTRIPDLNSGLRAMKREQVLEFLPILPTTHSWVSTITMAFLSNGYNVRWIPIAYRKRVGRSSFHPIADTYNYLSLVVRAIMYFNPLRVFLPVSLTVLLVGAVKMIYDIIAYRFHFAPSTVILMIGGLQLGAIGLLADLIVRRSKL
jgi:glycosyltransferase involved in cell wall biosynthesis